MLGDRVYSSDIETSCAKQIVDIYHQFKQSIIGLTVMPAAIIQKAGCITGTWQEISSVLAVTQIYEKPTIEYAKQNLRVEGMLTDEFLGVFGLYVLTPKIFDYLAENINKDFREKGEFQLTSCLDSLRQAEGMTGYLVKGKCFDIGIPDAYWQTLIDFRNAY